MKLRMVLRRKIGVGLLLGLIGSIGLSSCAFSKKVVLHPIDQEDIMPMKAGEAYAPDRDGYFLSEYYLEEVAKARVE